jgi:hypothetical protein
MTLSLLSLPTMGESRELQEDASGDAIILLPLLLIVLVPFCALLRWRWKQHHERRAQPQQQGSEQSDHADVEAQDFSQITVPESAPHGNKGFQV